MNCLHIETIEKTQTFKNGITHIRLECIDCGRFIKYKPQHIETFKLWFGKHKGKELKEVPKDYLEWYKKNGNDKKTIDRINLFFQS